jgi:glucose-1-phosphate thymidylyltransferase
MKALVLSGGRGTRLRPFSHAMPKQLIPVAGKPVLQYVIENIRDIGVTDVGIVAGDRAAEISEAMGDGSEFGVNITYISQDEPRGLADCVKIARPFLGEDDFVMYLGDNLLPEGIGDAARQFAATRPDAQVLVASVADPRAFGVVEVGAGDSVTGLAEKPAEPRSDLAIIGVYFFTAAIHDAVMAVDVSARGELEITDAIGWLLENGGRVMISRYRGYWKDAGIPEDVLTCNRYVLSKISARINGDLDAISEVYGPVIIEPGARIVHSRIIGPAVIGADTLVVDSFIGPDTSIGRSCEIRGTGLADSIIMDGAAVVGIPDLRRCLIGRWATVGTVQQQQAHHHLMVGDHTQIQLATGRRGQFLVPQELAERSS